METMFIEAKYGEKFTLPTEIINKLPKTVTLATTVQFIDSLEGIKQQLEEVNKTVKLFNGDHAKYPGQILGCSLNKQENTEAFLYIGTGEFHPKAILLNQNKPVFSYNPFTQSLKQLTEEDIEIIKKRQKGAYLKYKTSTNIGILVSTKPGQNHLNLAEKLKQKLKSEDKSPYIFIADTLNFSDLENFPFIECWVNTMCPRIGFDDTVRLEKPLINIQEL